jgi:hypothetical protein
MLSVVLYGCETWSLTLREEHGRRVLESMVLRRIFVPKRERMTIRWRKLYNEYPHDLHSSQNDKVEEDEVGRAYSTNRGVEQCVEAIDRKAREKETTRSTKS